MFNDGLILPGDNLLWDAPINWEHPLNLGLLINCAVVAQGGSQLKNLAAKTKGTDGTLVNGQTWGATDRKTGAGQLSLVRASSQYVSIPDNVNLNNVTTFTLSCWCKPTVVNVWNGLYTPISASFGGHMGWAISSGAKIDLIRNGSSDNLSTPSVVAGVWSHLCTTFDSGTANHYINGVPAGTIAGITAFNSPAGNAKALAWDGASGEYFGGGFDEFELRNRALTSGEVVALYRESVQGNPERYRRLDRKSTFPPISGITFDAASNGGYTAAANTDTWSHTNAGNYLIVGVPMLGVANVTSVTFNGDALTLLGSRTSAGSLLRMELWGMVAPDIGTFDITVNLDGSIAFAGVASSWFGVHQTTPTEGFNSATATNVGAADATVDITSVADNCMILDVLATSDGSVTVGAGQTQRNNVTGAAGSGTMSSEGPKTPAGAVTMSWTDIGALATWVIGGIALRPLAASGNSYSRTCTDAPTTSESLTRIGTFTRAITDAPVSSESLSRAGAFTRTITDAPVTSESVARIDAAVRATTDAPTVSESLTRSFAGTRTTTDAPTTSESVTRTYTSVRTTTDSPQTSEAVTRLFTGYRTVTDPPTLSEAITSIAGKQATTTESVTVSESLTRTIVLLRTASDSIALSESLARVGVFLRTTTDTLTISDVAISTGGGATYSAVIGFAIQFVHVQDVSMQFAGVQSRPLVFSHVQEAKFRGQ